MSLASDPLATSLPPVHRPTRVSSRPESQARVGEDTHTYRPRHAAASHRRTRICTWFAAQLLAAIAWLLDLTAENLARRALSGTQAQSIESRILLVTAAAIIYLVTNGLKRAAKRLGRPEP